VAAARLGWRPRSNGSAGPQSGDDDGQATDVLEVVGVDVTVNVSPVCTRAKTAPLR